MLYMSGSGVQIFSLGIVFMLLISPFKAVFSILQGECFGFVKRFFEISTLQLRYCTTLACLAGVGYYMAAHVVRPAMSFVLTVQCCQAPAPTQFEALSSTQSVRYATEYDCA